MARNQTFLVVGLALLCALCIEAKEIQEKNAPAVGSATLSFSYHPASELTDVPPLGWLTHPGVPPSHLGEALVSGKFSLNSRFRVEAADTTDRDSSTAITNRLRLGYQTKPFHGLSGVIEMESVFTLNEEDYFVPATGEGTSTRTVIADPTGIELNQAYGQFSTASLGDTNISLDLKAGRQRLKLDDERFIGSVGWRQFEQTFDAVSVQSNLGIDDLRVTYAYLWGVNRIFGPDGPNPDSDSHLIRVSYSFAPELSVVLFSYLLDFEEDEPLNSVNTYGFRASGAISRDTGNPGDVWFDYELTYAYQTDAGSNPVDFEASFFAAQARLSRKGIGSIAVGYQYLGSDNGSFGFRFPLGTNHKFQGYADQFLVTPATGLQDFYVVASANLPFGIVSSVGFHQFFSDEGGDDIGHEIDFAVSKKITSNVSVLVKGAFFDGDKGLPDTTRVWFQTTIKF